MSHSDTIFMSQMHPKTVHQREECGAAECSVWVVTDAVEVLLMPCLPEPVILLAVSVVLYWSRLPRRACSTYVVIGRTRKVTEQCFIVSEKHMTAC